MPRLLILAALVVALAGWPALSLADGPAAKGTPTAKQIEPAPDFTLPRLDGTELHLADTRGQVVLVNFWATWCPPCRGEMPGLEALWQRYREQGLAVVGVSEDTGRLAWIERNVAELGVTFPVLLDREGQVGRRYRVTGLPASVLIGRDGTIAARIVGYRDWTSEGAHLLVQLLLGQTP
jgi:peroxiredoxin